MQATGRLLRGSVTQQHLTSCWQVRQRLRQLHHLASVLYLFGHIMHLQQPRNIELGTIEIKFMLLQHETPR